MTPRLYKRSFRSWKRQPRPRTGSPISQSLTVLYRRLKDGYPGYSGWAFCLQGQARPGRGLPALYELSSWRQDCGLLGRCATSAEGEVMQEPRTLPWTFVSLAAAAVTRLG